MFTGDYFERLYRRKSRWDCSLYYR